MDLNDALLALEQAAAVVESFLPADLSEAELLAIAAGWGPPPRHGGGSKATVLVAQVWLSWLRQCADRWESRPVEPEVSLDAIHKVIIEWACANPERPARDAEIDVLSKPLLRTDGQDL